MLGEHDVERIGHREVVLGGGECLDEKGSELHPHEVSGGQRLHTTGDYVWVGDGGHLGAVGARIRLRGSSAREPTTSRPVGAVLRAGAPPRCQEELDAADASRTRSVTRTRVVPRRRAGDADGQLRGRPVLAERGEPVVEEPVTAIGDDDDDGSFSMSADGRGTAVMVPAPSCRPPWAFGLGWPSTSSTRRGCAPRCRATGGRRCRGSRTRGVAEAGLDDLHGFAVRDQQRGVEVAEVVEPQAVRPAQPRRRRARPR